MRKGVDRVSGIVIEVIETISYNFSNKIYRREKKKKRMPKNAVVAKSNSGIRPNRKFPSSSFSRRCRGKKKGGEQEICHSRQHPLLEPQVTKKTSEEMKHGTRASSIALAAFSAACPNGS